MISKLFLYIYTLTIPGLVSICIFGLICFLLLEYHCGKQWWWKPALGSVLLLWAGIVWYITILSRTGGLESSLALIPFHSYREVLAGGNPELIRSNLMNVVLFIPAGLLTVSMLPSRWTRRGKLLVITLAFCLFSGGIEAAQYLLAMGQAEIDDVIHNGLGALLGTLPFIVKDILHNPVR